MDIKIGNNLFIGASSTGAFGVLILGTNVFQDCDSAIIIDGEEVFRLRERQNDGQFIVDFDVRGLNDERIAKIAKNHVVYAAPGYSVKSEPGRYEVLETDKDRVVASVVERGPVAIQVSGAFYVKGSCIVASQSGLHINGAEISGNQWVSAGKPIVIENGSFNMGL